MKLICALVFPFALLVVGCASIPPLPQVASGQIVRLADFPSQHVAPRPVDVWLPPGYDGSRPHAVLYMHDGQMLFDSSTTWNKRAWDVHVPLSRLIAEGRLRETIVVGVHNTGETRFAEYFPQGFVPHLPEEVQERLLGDRAHDEGVLSDAYLRFLVTELKPAIDARFATDPRREPTTIAGSSMGGLISIYALCEYPDVFGGAAALSTHWIGFFERNEEVPASAVAYLRENLPPPGRHRIWMDRGTEDLDALYDQAQPRIDALMEAKGFGPPDFVSRVYRGEGHYETAWARRFDEVLLHLLPR